MRPGSLAVIFTNQRSGLDADGYDRMAARMEELAREQPGFLGVDSVRGPDGFGITISYWESREAIRAWREHPEHQEAQRLGRERWYESYRLDVAEVQGPAADAEKA